MDQAVYKDISSKPVELFTSSSANTLDKIFIQLYSLSWEWSLRFHKNKNKTIQTKTNQLFFTVNKLEFSLCFFNLENDIDKRYFGSHWNYYLC